MVNFRKHLAWLCSASLWCGTAAWADEPVAFPFSPEASSNIEDVTSRINDLQQLIEQQNGELKRQSQLLDDLQSHTGKIAAIEYAVPTSGGTSTVQGSVFGLDGTAAGTFGSDGLTFVSKDGHFKMHAGGVVQLDATGFGAIGSGIANNASQTAAQNSVDFRRLRLRFDGTMYDWIDYVMETDYALSLQNFDQKDAAAQALGLRSTGGGNQGGNTMNVIQPTTIFMTFKDIPILGNIRVGNQQSWLSLEHIESARFLDFMERSTIMDAFNGANNNGYAPGISVFNNTADKNAGLQLGVYKNNVYDSGFTYNIGNAWTYGGRAIWTPFYDEESKGRYLVHTGFGAEHRTFNQNPGANTGGDNVRVRSRGLLRNAPSTLDPNYADTGNFYAVGQTILNPEIAIQMGPLLLQAEYTASWFNGAKTTKTGADLGSVFMHGGYAEALYFLTGENRVYNRQSGVFGRVIPHDNANPKNGCWGAWQTGVRYSWLDLGTLGGGGITNSNKEQDLTLGMNWFLNPNTRFQFNYVFSAVNNSAIAPGSPVPLNGSRFVGDGLITSFGTRMDFTF